MTTSLALASLLLVAASNASPPPPAPAPSAAARPAPPAAPRAPRGAVTVEALIRRCVDAYGGKAALVRSARVRQEGTVTSLVLQGGEKGRMVRAYERPGRLRVEIAYPGGTSEVRVLDGGRGWRDGEEARGPRLQAMILQAMRLDLPSLLMSWQAKVMDAGALEVGGKKLRLLAIVPAPGLILEAAIDPSTGRIMRSRGASTDPAVPIEFLTTYSDFKKVRGVLVAMREQNWANGQSTGETVLAKVEFPAELPENTFRP